MLQNFVSYYLLNFYYVCSYLFRANLGAKKEIMIGCIDSTSMFLMQFEHRIAFHDLKKKITNPFYRLEKEGMLGHMFFIIGTLL